MNPLYHLGLWLYRLVARLISPFHTKAALFSKGHSALIYKMKQQITHECPIVWFHCASLGEFEQGRPIMEGYRLAQPGHKIVVTFFSPSGYEVVKGNPVADWIYYLPLDTCRNVRRFLDTVQPVKAIFIKYEFWYNFLRALKKRGIPTYIVSAAFRPSQPFFRWYGAVFRRMLRMFTWLFVQDGASESLLLQIGVSNVIVAGDTRFDRVWKQSHTPCSLPVVEAFCCEVSGGAAWVCIAGSTWPRDEALLLHLLEAHRQVKLILVPHEVDEDHIESIMKLFAPFSPVRYSQLSGAKKVLHGAEIVPDGAEKVLKDAGWIPSGVGVLVVDTIGLLSSLYRYGSMAYLGGGFDHGIHNTLEAAVYGVPVIFGPKYERFNEAVDLVRLGGAYSIRSQQELLAQIGRWLSEPERRTEAGRVCAAYVARHGGATEQVLDAILERTDDGCQKSRIDVG